MNAERARGEDELRVRLHDRAVRVPRKGRVQSVLGDSHGGMAATSSLLRRATCAASHQWYGAGCRNRWRGAVPQSMGGGMRQWRIGRDTLANPAQHGCPNCHSRDNNVLAPVRH